jgi:hypothetical protein
VFAVVELEDGAAFSMEVRDSAWNVPVMEGESAPGATPLLSPPFPEAAGAPVGVPPEAVLAGGLETVVGGTVVVVVVDAAMGMA